MAEEKQKVNTTKSMKDNAKATSGQLDAEMKQAAKILGKQKKEKVHIPAYLEKRLGKNVPVGINGAVIHVPVGEDVEIPEAMAKQLNETLKNLKL